MARAASPVSDGVMLQQSKAEASPVLVDSGTGAAIRGLQGIHQLLRLGLYRGLTAGLGLRYFG